jgi:hypothetical protein
VAGVFEGDLATDTNVVVHRQMMYVDGIFRTCLKTDITNTLRPTIDAMTSSSGRQDGKFCIVPCRGEITSPLRDLCGTSIGRKRLCHQTSGNTSKPCISPIRKHPLAQFVAFRVVYKIKVCRTFISIGADTPFLSLYHSHLLKSFHDLSLS